MLRTFLRVILTVIIGVFTPLVFLVQSPIYLYRFIIVQVVKRWYPSTYGKILTAASTCMAVDDITSKPKWSLLLRLTLTGNSGFEEFKRRFEERVVFSKNKHRELRKPELQQYVSQKFGFLFWKWDKEFRIENHIIQKVDGFEYDVLNPEVINNLMQTLVYKPFTPTRSPWELMFLENYQDENSKVDGETRHIVILRIHHSLADGYSIMKMITLDFCGSPKLEVAVSKYLRTSANQTKAKTIRQRIARLLTPIQILIRIPYDMADATIEIIQYNSNVWHLPEAKLKRSVNAAQCTIPIETVKNLKDLYSCSFGTVIIAIYTAALRKFMIEAGYSFVPEYILCGMALPVANHPDDKLRNHASACLARLPTGLSDPIQRIREIEKNQIKIKSSTLSISMFYSGILTGSLFARMVKSMTVNRNTTVVGSIFAAPSNPVPAGNFTVVDSSYAGGFTRGNVGLAFSCMSFNSKLNLLIGIDEGLVPEAILPATKMVDYIHEELHILKEGAYSERNTHDNMLNCGGDVV